MISQQAQQTLFNGFNMWCALKLQSFLFINREIILTTRKVKHGVLLPLLCKSVTLPFLGNILLILSIIAWILITVSMFLGFLVRFLFLFVGLWILWFCRWMGCNLYPWSVWLWLRFVLIWWWCVRGLDIVLCKVVSILFFVKARWWK